MKQIFSTLILSLLSILLYSQDTHFYFDFDDCTAEESGLSYPALSLGGLPECVCGINESAYSLDGLNDYLEFAPETNALFSENFTFDFYFWLNPTVGDMDIMSLRSGCGKLDSLMQLRYQGADNEILFEIGSNINNYRTFRSKLNQDYCWHRFTLVKFDLEYYVYLDNNLIDKFVARENIVMTKVGLLNFGNNPCNNTNVIERFSGRIDEIKLYKRALSDLEILNNYNYPDRIINNNTTIFKGDSLQINTGYSCAYDYRWAPSEFIDEPTSAHPIVYPEETTTFKVTFNNEGCTGIDTIKVFVADKENLDCKNLLLPKAFTPNHDGLNDTYGISNKFIIDELKYFEVYDRWGEKVWDTTQIHDEWDGFKNNIPLNSGTYLYKIKYVCDNKDYVKIDNFILMR